MIKGALDVLIGKCTNYTTIEGESKVLDDNTRAIIEVIKNTWSSQGKRVILLARKTVCKEEIINIATPSKYEEEVKYHAKSGLTLVGIMGIVDPPRDEIPSVVSILRGAGIRIFMVHALCTQEIHQTHLIIGHRRLCVDCTSYRNRVWYHH